MRILFISNELIGSALCSRLQDEGHEVKLYIHHPARKNCLDGLIHKVSDWRKELRWVGKDGLIIFDDVGFGKIQDDLRNRGYTVFGGSLEGDALELDRAFGQRVLHDNGIKILPSFNFKHIDSAIEFVSENKGKWVVKQTSHISILNHVGELDDASDVISVLKEYKKRGIQVAHLQKKVDGIEVGIARYFNGHDWVGPIEINHEHKRLYNNDLGPLTAEMGTVMWHSDDENFPLFMKILKKMTPYLQKIGYKGDIDINCIVTQDQAWPLEITPRLGTPSTQLQCELYESSIGEFFYALSKGEKVRLKYKKEYGIVAAIGVPPFPYPPKETKGKRKKHGDVLQIDPNLSEEAKKSIYLEEVSKRKNASGQDELYWSGAYGYVAYVTAAGDSIPKTQKKIKQLLSSVSIPEMTYRTDIGDRVHRKDLPLLKKWGWI
jgi:phosphoribosylamine---glycine ligase